jgi:hypothetical protein
VFVEGDNRTVDYLFFFFFVTIFFFAAAFLAFFLAMVQWGKRNRKQDLIVEAPAQSGRFL